MTQRRPLMRRRSILAILVLVLVLVFPMTVAADDPPGPTTRHQFRVAGLPVVGLAEMNRFSLEFAPGAATPAHDHPGQVLVTVLEGEVTLVTPGAKKVNKVGDSFIESPNEVGTASNTGTGKARVVVSIVAPQGPPLATEHPGGPSPAPATPTTFYFVNTAAILPGDPYEVVQQVLDFAPGAQTPVHTHPGQVFVTVLEGELTFKTGGADKVYRVGESFIEQPGVAAQARNAGAVRTTTHVTYLLPQGVPLSAPVAPTAPATGTGGNLPGLPNTGAGGGTAVPLGWLVLLACGALASGAQLLRRRARRA